MESATNPEEANYILGKAVLVRALYEGRDIGPTWDSLFKRVSSNLGDAAAFLDLSIILQTLGQPEKAATAQKAALDISRKFRIKNGRGTGLNVLVFVTAGDFMANTPIEFLLERSDANILLHYVDAQTRDLSDVPDHDVAFIAVGESAENLPVLQNLDELLRSWRGPVVNRAPRRIIGLSRDGVAAALRDEPSVLAPATTRMTRESLQKAVSAEDGIASIVDTTSGSIIVRPIGTHAGQGMEKLSSLAELSRYLASREEPAFYVSPFIDYSGPDGKFRKQRIAFIDGKAFASHLAVSDHWMVHYLSAGMAQHEDRRQEEARWMADFDDDFSARHARAFEAIYQRLGLDYFAIDCAELADDRLLLFEADIAMIVHAMDSDTVFPYKKQAMEKLFAAFEASLRRHSRDLPPVAGRIAPLLGNDEKHSPDADRMPTGALM